jgi:hypothetical protein
MPSEQIQTQSDDLELAKLLGMTVVSMRNGGEQIVLNDGTTAHFSPSTSHYDERFVIQLLNSLGYCVQIVYYPEYMSRVTVLSQNRFERQAAIASNSGKALVEAAIALLKQNAQPT